MILQDNESDEETIVLVSGKLGTKLQDKWLADSGATSHMCRVKQWFSKYTPYPKPVKCKVGDGNKVDVLGEGEIAFSTKVDGRATKAILRNVLYIPTLTTNLVSVGALADAGTTTIFDNGKCFLKNNNHVIAEGTRLRDKLYTLNLEVKQPSHKALYTKEARTMTEWHQTLGHTTKPNIVKLAKQSRNEMKIIDPNSDIHCSDCPAGKATNSPHPSRETKVNEVGHRAHMDLSGRINRISINGFQYFLLVKDEHSEYTHAAFLKDKGETWNRLAEIIIKFEEESGREIKRIVSDNGSEFRNENVRILFLKERIVHEFSANYTPQQNGCIERAMRTIVSTARILLASANLDLKLWPEAIESAVYLRNRIPTSREDKTPFERYRQRAPKLKHILTFGRSARTQEMGRPV